MSIEFFNVLFQIWMNVLRQTDQIAPMVQPVLIHGGVRNVFALEIAMDRRVNIVRAGMLPLPIFTVQTIKLLKQRP